MSNCNKIVLAILVSCQIAILCILPELNTENIYPMSLVQCISGAFIFLNLYIWLGKVIGMTADGLFAGMFMSLAALIILAANKNLGPLVPQMLILFEVCISAALSDMDGEDWDYWNFS